MLQWADTLNHYGTNTALLLNGLYAENIDAGGSPTSSLLADPDTNSTAKVFRCGTNWPFTQTQGLRYVLTATQPTVGMAGKLWMSAVPAQDASTPCWEWRDNTNAMIVRMRPNTVGGIAVFNSAGTKIGETTGPVLSANAWHHLEAKVFRSATVGTFEVRVNGTVALALTGLNLGASDIAQVVWGSWQTANTGLIISTYYKQLVLWDGTGTYNNNFMGTCSVIDINTDADVSLTWTPNSGAVGWSILDNNPPTDDTNYIAAATAVLANQFSLENLPSDVTSVRGGVVINRSRKIDGGDGNVQTSLVSGASTGAYTDRPITVAYTYWKDVFETDPATGVQFTPTAFNAAKLKLSRTV
jgi:hypothetical protein